MQDHVDAGKLWNWLFFDGRRLSSREDEHLSSCKDCIATLKLLLDHHERNYGAEDDLRQSA